jgi:hypothetical protein
LQVGDEQSIDSVFRAAFGNWTAIAESLARGAEPETWARRARTVQSPNDAQRLPRTGVLLTRFVVEAAEAREPTVLAEPLWNAPNFQTRCNETGDSGQFARSRAAAGPIGPLWQFRPEPTRNRRLRAFAPTASVSVFTHHAEERRYAGFEELPT